MADGARRAGDPAVPRPAARPRRHRGDRREEADTAAAPHRQERGGQAAQCPGAVFRPTPGARWPVRGPQDADAEDRAVGARCAREHRDPAHRRRAARRAGLGPYDARGAGGARAARPVPRRVRGGPAGRRARGPAVDPGRAAPSAEPARRAARTAALPGAFLAGAAGAPPERAVPPASDGACGHDRAGRRGRRGAGAHADPRAVRQPRAGDGAQAARPARGRPGMGAPGAGGRAGRGGLGGTPARVRGGRVGPLRLRIVRHPEGIVRRPAPGAAHRGLRDRAAHHARAGVGPGCVRARGAGRAGAVAALHRPVRGGPAAAAAGSHSPGGPRSAWRRRPRSSRRTSRRPPAI